MAVDPVLRANAISALDFWTPLMLRAIADAGVVTAFGVDRRSCRVVGEETGLHVETLRRVLRALAARGIFHEDDDGVHFALTPLGQALLPEHPSSVWSVVNWQSWALHAWAEFGHTLRTGEPCFDRHHGATFFEYLARDEQAGAKFDADMQRRTSALLDTALPLFDAWPTEGTVIDVGGGTGALLCRLLADRPGLRGTLFDAADVLERAAPILAAHGVADRVDSVAGDFFVEVPSGHDLYVMASVLHDWDDEQARRILERCRDAMPPHARVLLFEALLRGPNEPDTFKNLDLHMAVLLGGRERTRDELGPPPRLGRPAPPTYRPSPRACVDRVPPGAVSAPVRRGSTSPQGALRRRHGCASPRRALSRAVTNGARLRAGRSGCLAEDAHAYPVWLGLDGAHLRIRGRFPRHLRVRVEMAGKRTEDDTLAR